MRMARQAGSIFEAGTAVFFDLDNTLIDRDRARDKFFSYLLTTYFPHLTPEEAAWADRMETMRALDRSVFVGDSLEHDMVGARNAGMMTVYLNRSGASDVDEFLCDLVVSDLRELSDRVIDLDS